MKGSLAWYHRRLNKSAFGKQTVDSCDRILCLAQCYLRWDGWFPSEGSGESWCQSFRWGSRQTVLWWAGSHGELYLQLHYGGSQGFLLMGLWKWHLLWAHCQETVDCKLWTWSSQLLPQVALWYPPSILEDCLKNYALEQKEFRLMAELLP